MARKPPTPKSVEALKHDEATRKNIPTGDNLQVMSSLAEFTEVYQIEADFEKKIETGFNRIIKFYTDRPSAE